MQTSAAINFEQVLFRFERNCLIRSEQFGWKRQLLAFAETAGDRTALTGIVQARIYESAINCIDANAGGISASQHGQ